MQLVLCLTLCLAIFLGKSIFPERASEIQERLSAVLAYDMDLREHIAELGRSLSQGEDVLSDLGELCVAVFGDGDKGQEVQQTSIELPPNGVLTSELQYLSRGPDQVARAQHYAQVQKLGLEIGGTQPVLHEETPPPEETVAAAGTVLIHTGYDGPPLPEHYTMDKLSLGELETTTPVLGHLNSTYGYREHPIDGRHQFHGGVDLGGQMGDPISAFAAGTVEYVGQDDSYGLYFQLDHGNGVRSFYAHCSRVLVQKGQQVALGETVALVGASGAATGPHLHLELKYGKMHMDPAYYIQVLERG